MTVQITQIPHIIHSRDSNLTNIDGESLQQMRSRPGHNRHELGLVIVDFQIVGCHPCFYFRDAFL